MEKIAVDLLWLRPGQVGGTESYIRNLLDGLCRLGEDFCFVLLVSQDNRDTFVHYAEDRRFALLETNVVSAHIGQRILWQFFFENRFLKKNGITRCFSPVYCRPLCNGGVRYVNTIHDLQAAHYPEYHPFYEVAYSRLCWWLDTHFSTHIIAISDWVKEDIQTRYRLPDERITTIYNPIVADRGQTVPFSVLRERYGVEEQGFYYTVSQMIPHKNLGTLLEVMRLIRERDMELPHRLLISGVNSAARSDVERQIRENGLESDVTLTGYVENAERNTLYQHCRAFLFPSVFEGFGMPPVEAMLFGTVVITTDRASIPEVTQHKANYVSDPYDAEAWLRAMEHPENHSKEMDPGRYDSRRLAGQYLTLLQEKLGNGIDDGKRNCCYSGKL